MQNIIDTSLNVTSHGDTPARHTYSKPKSTVQVSVAEFTMLKDTVSRMEADMLKMKQTMQATDKLRAEQTTTIRTTVNSIKVAMHDLSACISNAVTNCQKVSDSVASSLTETMKNGLNSLENRVQSLENTTRQRGTANVLPNISVRSPVPNTYNISPRATHPMYPIHAFPVLCHFL